MTTRAGILLRAGGELGFVPANVARQVVPLPTLSSVANTPLAMAIVGGQVVPVVALGTARSALVLCDIDGEIVGFSGLEVDRVGLFEAAEGGVTYQDRVVHDLELEAALRSLEQALEPRIGEPG